MQTTKPGLIVLLGSGETQPSSGKTHEYIASQLPNPPRIAILETPAGFELNADRVAGKIKDFLETRLTNYGPNIVQIPARKKKTAFSPDDPQIIAPLYQADEILLGPGSPTYAVRQLKDSLAYDAIRAKNRMGSVLFLSSAATLAFGCYTIPVYEIFKVGEDIHWQQGLNFFGDFGLSLSIVPHWNNNDGGEELDTSRCYIGRSRFDALYQQVPDGQVFMGIDDHTSVVIDLVEKICKVMGNGRVILLKNGEQLEFKSGEVFDLELIGTPFLPEAGEGLDPKAWEKTQLAIRSRKETEETVPEPPKAVVHLLRLRTTARNENDWDRADSLREEIESLGWQVVDTLEGSELEPIK
jgi:hypothetical protein